MIPERLYMNAKRNITEVLVLEPQSAGLEADLGFTAVFFKFCSGFILFVFYSGFIRAL